MLTLDIKKDWDSKDYKRMCALLQTYSFKGFEYVLDEIIEDTLNPKDEIVCIVMKAEDFDVELIFTRTPREVFGVEGESSMYQYTIMEASVPLVVLSETEEEALDDRSIITALNDAYRVNHLVYARTLYYKNEVQNLREILAVERNRYRALENRMYQEIDKLRMTQTV